MAMMQRSMDKNDAGFSKLDREMAATKHEAREAKELAAKATTLAKETQNQMEALAKRVTKLENGPPTQVSPQTRQHRPKEIFVAQSAGKRDRDFLGGEEGDTAVVGGLQKLRRQRGASGRMGQRCTLICPKTSEPKSLK